MGDVNWLKYGWCLDYFAFVFGALMFERCSWGLISCFVELLLILLELDDFVSEVCGSRLYLCRFPVLEHDFYECSCFMVCLLRVVLG